MALTVHVHDLRKVEVHSHDGCEYITFDTEDGDHIAIFIPYEIGKPVVDAFLKADKEYKERMALELQEPKHA